MLDPAFDRVLRTAGAVPRDTAAAKVVPLAAAVHRLVRPGMTLHFATAAARPCAAVYEVIRQFHGRDPRFTMAALGCSGPWVLPVASGIVAKVITSFAGDAYPTPGPNPVYQRTYRDGSVVYELWSILTHTLRLKAAALGVPYLPTRSLVGSTMAEENGDAVRIIDGPEPLAHVSALVPDVSFVHAWAADRSGNAVLAPPFGENVYGALAASSGVIVTADHIVPTETLRRYNACGLLPGSNVRAVCEARYGAHPTGMSAHAFPDAGWVGYADDYPFLEAMRAAAKTPDTMADFLAEWVLDTQDWNAVTAKLGRDRLARLERLAQPDGWEVELDEGADALDAGAPANGIERMILAASDYVQRRMRAGELDTLLAGVGASNLAAWLAHAAMRQRGEEANLMAEVGFFGYHPRPADPFIFNLRNVPTCTALADVETIMGLFMSGARGRTLGVLGAGQVDRFGNINSTRIGSDGFLVGSGGANDVCSGAREVLVCALQSRARFVTQVDYITGPGARVRTVVTPHAVFEKLDGADTLTLTAVLTDGDVADGVREATDRCGWDVRVVDRPERVPAPAPEALHLLRLFDPRRQFLGKAA